MAEALYQMYNLRLRLDIKHGVDGGTVHVLASDVAGTVVFFTKPFKDVDSITLTAHGTTEQNPVYDFLDVPNPVSFKILLFSGSGVRINGDVSWKARGKV